MISEDTMSMADLFPRETNLSGDPWSPVLPPLSCFTWIPLKKKNNNNNNSIMNETNTDTPPGTRV